MHAKSPEFIQLRVADRAGPVAEASVAVYDAAPARVTLTSGGLTLDVGGVDLLDCLVELRLALEAEGSLLCCQGARPDVWPSGQLRQFSNGREGYVLKPVSTDGEHQVVDLFAPADLSEVVTVAEQ